MNTLTIRHSECTPSQLEKFNLKLQSSPLLHLNLSLGLKNLKFQGLGFLRMLVHNGSLTAFLIGLLTLKLDVALVSVSIDFRKLVFRGSRLHNIYVAHPGSKWFDLTLDVLHLWINALWEGGFLGGGCFASGWCLRPWYYCWCGTYARWWCRWRWWHLRGWWLGRADGTMISNMIYMSLEFSMGVVVRGTRSMHRGWWGWARALVGRTLLDSVLILLIRWPEIAVLGLPIIGIVERGRGSGWGMKVWSLLELRSSSMGSSGQGGGRAFSLPFPWASRGSSKMSSMTSLSVSLTML